MFPTRSSKLPPPSYRLFSTSTIQNSANSSSSSPLLMLASNSGNISSNSHLASDLSSHSNSTLNPSIGNSLSLPPHSWFTNDPSTGLDPSIISVNLLPSTPVPYQVNIPQYWGLMPPSLHNTLSLTTRAQHFPPSPWTTRPSYHPYRQSTTSTPYPTPTPWNLPTDPHHHLRHTHPHPPTFQQQQQQHHHYLQLHHPTPPSHPHLPNPAPLPAHHHHPQHHTISTNFARHQHQHQHFLHSSHSPVQSPQTSLHPALLPHPSIPPPPLHPLSVPSPAPGPSLSQCQPLSCQLHHLHHSSPPHPLQLHTRTLRPHYSSPNKPALLSDTLTSPHFSNQLPHPHIPPVFLHSKPSPTSVTESDGSPPLTYSLPSSDPPPSSTPKPPRPTPSLILPHFSSHSSYSASPPAAQLRERVYSWAQMIYLDLVNYLQSTRNKPVNYDRPSVTATPPASGGITNSPCTTPNSASATRPTPQTFPSGLNQARASSTSLSLNPRIDTSNHQNLPTWNLKPSNSCSAPLANLDGYDPASSISQNPSASFNQHYDSSSPSINSLGHRTGLLSGSESCTEVNTNSAQGSQSFRETQVFTTSIFALESLTDLIKESCWQWIDGMLLAGRLAFGLADYQTAVRHFSAVLVVDKTHVEAMSSLAETLLVLNRKGEAEQYWLNAVKLHPSYFDAVEHLVAFFCNDHRGVDSVAVIEFVENSLRLDTSKSLQLSHAGKHSKLFPPSSTGSINGENVGNGDNRGESGLQTSVDPDKDKITMEPKIDTTVDGTSVLSTTYYNINLPDPSQLPGFGLCGYAIPGYENGRMLQLIHAKGNMLYAMGDSAGAARAFEQAVLLGVGRQISSGGGGISELVCHILKSIALGNDDLFDEPAYIGTATNELILLPPDRALTTAKLCFPPHGHLPGLKYVTDTASKKVAVATTSNSLLSLAKTFQDGIASSTFKTSSYHLSFGVREILALYYLSISLQPSPSTANNVGILLAGVQQAVPNRKLVAAMPLPNPHIPGVAPGSGIALALAYYNYGLNLDARHAHLYTNLGSLLKDIGQLEAAIKMYEQAVSCDGNFDIALANLANAVKDQGRISDAISYYKRAVAASPDFAEAVCGLANALNSVCSWNGRGGISDPAGKRDRWHVDENGLLVDGRDIQINGSVKGGGTSGSCGWMKKVVDLVDKQLQDGQNWGRGTIDEYFVDQTLRSIDTIYSWCSDIEAKKKLIQYTLRRWSGQKWEGARIVRLVERIMKQLTWQWYQDLYVKPKVRPETAYTRPNLPRSLTTPIAPTVLPFHTFTCPMSARQIRQISQRNGLRISCSTLKAPWLSTIVCRPPSPPNPYLRVGYVSSDFNNHPLAHLMQSVFGLHDPSRVKAYCYATTASDKSIHRQQIEREAPVIHDASSWSAERLINQIVQDEIHILVNLNGYTRGARNEVFAARPAPIQMSFMGFAGTLGAEWCDYILADETAIPTSTLRPWRRNVDVEDQLSDESFNDTSLVESRLDSNEQTIATPLIQQVTTDDDHDHDDNNNNGEYDEWVYSENIIYCKDTFFCCDHRQSAPDVSCKQLNWEEEMIRRWNMRKEIFPDLADDFIIFGNFNQLYKIEPTTFRTWLRILARIPKSILWLLRFPDLGETHLRRTAKLWAGDDVASRIFFSKVAPKNLHISRGRVCDLFLDTPECNAHTTSADILWSGTPLLTLGRYKYKMCSRMAASILKGALPKTPKGIRAAKELIAETDEEYEEFAVRLAKATYYDGHRPCGRLGQIRKILYESRFTSALFNTKRWVQDLESACWIAWDRWERGVGGDIWLDSPNAGELRSWKHAHVQRNASVPH